MADTFVLFGAFDRHNIGDLLFPHVAEALLGPGARLIHAGLASADLRAYGGHEVHSLVKLAAEGALEGATLIHVGGETLSCSAWLAALMLLPPGEVDGTIGWLSTRPEVRAAWLRERLGTAAEAPYVVSRERCPGLRRIVHAGVGGCALGAAPPAMRDEVLASLRTADALGVREAHTLAQLLAAGVSAQLLPDPAVMVAELFGARIAASGAHGEPAAMRTRFPRGYVAVQFSAEFGDDATLDALAKQLDLVAAGSGLGLVFFRMGTAPFHDDLGVLQRAAERLRTPQRAVFESLSAWDVCALIQGSAGFAGSSLHGRILAMAFARPRISLRSPVASGGVGKQAAFAASWELPGLPGAVATDACAEALNEALAAPRPALHALARDLAARYRHGFAALLARAGV